MKRKVISIILILTLLQAYICTVIAATTSELNGQKDDIQGKVDDAKKEQAQIQEQLDEEMKEISNLDYEIEQGEAEVEKLTTQIKELETSISEKEKLIEKYKQNDINEEIKKKEKYNPETIFSKENLKIEEETKEVQLVEYKSPSFWKRLINFIKRK